MKQAILQFSILLITFFTAFQSQGQVTINRSDFPRLANFIDSVNYTNQAGIVAPSEGPNQVWNYSSLEYGELRTFEHFDATTDVNFPGTLNYRNADLSFQGFIIESNEYEAIDDIGFYEYGRSITDVTYPITAITGGPNDILRFIGENQQFDGDVDEIEFPMTYQDAWTDTRYEYINFELTVAAFGLNQTPGYRSRLTTQTRTVVGHGSLTIPKSDGSPSVPLDALLVKVERTYVDSFFLGGAPAPPALLSAFGLTQGATDEFTYYNFYTPGFAGRVLDIGISSTGSAEDAFYRPQAADGLTATHDLNLSPINYFPNPISAGETMTVTTEKPIGSGYVSFTDLAGRKVFQVAFESASDNQFQIDIPVAIAKGLYMYHVLDQKGIPVGLGKLTVE